MNARLTLVAVLALLAPAVFAEPPDHRVREARAAFADRDYARGVALYRALVAERPGDPAAREYGMMVVRGLSLAGDPGAAVEAGEDYLARYPGSKYLEKVAYLTARSLLLTGRGKEADALLAASFERIRGPAARARIAAYYLKAADRAFAGVLPKGPFDSGTPPDYARALRLYGLARQTGVPAKLRPAVLLRIAKAAVETKGYALALDALDSLGRDTEAGRRPEALFLRGRVLLGFGTARRAEAEDAFHRVVATAPDSEWAPEALRLLDTPESLQRLVREYPDHAAAPAAALREGKLLATAGEVDRAVAAFDRAVETFPGAPEGRAAALAAADALFAAHRYDEAKSRYDAFLRRWPESAEWARARDRLVESWFRRGTVVLAEKGPDDASEIWSVLRATYPLSPLAPRTLMAEAGARKDAAALPLYRELVARYPSSGEAPVAAYRAADILASMPGKVEDAIAALRRIVADYAGTHQGKQAEERLAHMREPELSIELPAPLRPDEKPALVLRTRNLERVTARAWKIDPVAYFEEHESLSDIEDVMVEVVAPDLEFAHEVEGYEEFRKIEGRLPVPVTEAGAWIVVVEGGELRATGLLLVSGITLITKESPEGVLAFVTRAGDGSPVEGVEIRARGTKGERVAARTGPDGVAQVAFENGSGGVAVLASEGGSVAFTGFGTVRRKVTALETRVHVSTDRPVYRPGDEVRWRTVVRRAAGDRFETPSGAPYRLMVVDGAGNFLTRAAGRLSEFGTANGAFALPRDLPPGTYSIVTVFREKRYGAKLEVEAYRKPQIFLGVDPERPVFVRGDEVRFAVTARYSFGLPVPDLEMPVRVTRAVAGEKEERVLSKVVRTDEEGRASLAVPTVPGPDMEIRVHAEATDVTRRIYVATARIPVAAAGVVASLEAAGDRAFVGETVRLVLRTTDPRGEPIAAKGRIEVARGQPGSYANVDSMPVATGPEGRTEVEWLAEREGSYRFRYVGADRRGNRVVAIADVAVETDEDRVVVRAVRGEYRVGEEATVEVAAGGASGGALLTFEGERIYGYRVIQLTGRRDEFRFPVTADLFPDARVRISLAREGRLLTGEDTVAVDQEIRVEVAPERTDYHPGEVCRLSVKTMDLGGEPLPAEVAVAVVDEGIFVLHPDGTPELVSTFRPRARGDLVRTRSSVSFSYEGKTSRVSDDLLAERERRQSDKSPAKGLLLEEKSLEKKADAKFAGPSTNDAIGIGGGAGGAFGGRGGRRNLRAGGGGKAGAESLLEPRREFRDTAFWRASVVTGSDGEAHVEFVLPDDLTEWRITARAAGHGNVFGEARSSFATSLPLVIRAALPRFLREGDELVAAAGVVNGTGEEIRADVTLSPSADGEVTESHEVAAGREAAVDWPIRAGEIGSTEYTARVGTSTLAEDTEVRSLATLPFGVPYRIGFAGASTEAGERVLVLPEDRVPGTVRLTLRIAPSLLRSALDGVEELREFPYGCTEQTVNRFFPALEAARAIRTLGLDAAEVLPEMDRIARDGALRLTYLQNGQGLWGWWQKGSTNPEMTAYALIGLGRARAAGVEFSKSVLEKAGKALPGLIGKTADADLRAFLLLGSSLALGSDFATLAPAFADRDQMTIEGMAWLAMAYEPLGETDQRAILLDGIRARIRGSGTPDTESLGWVLAAVAGADPASPLARELADELVRRRSGRSFATTRATGAAVIGLARVAAGAGIATASTEAVVSLNGEEVTREKIAGGPLTGRVIRIPADRIRPGGNRVAVTGSGGAFHYALELTCVRRDVPEPAGPLAISRRLTIVPLGAAGAVDPAASAARARGGEGAPEVNVVRAGEAVRVELTIGNGADERYLVVEEPLPAGFEVVPDSESGPFLEATRHDDRMVFFLESPPRESTISFVVRSEAPGHVRIPPGTVYAMYRPEAASWSGETALTVAARDAKIDRDPTVGLMARDLLDGAKALDARGRHPEAIHYLEALLSRFVLARDAKLAALRLLATARLAAEDSEGAVRAYVRLRAEVPGAGRELRDHVLLARAFRTGGRHGEAVQEMEAATAELFAEDAKVPEAIGGEEVAGFESDLLDLYPFASYAEVEWLSIVRKRATAYEEALANGREGDPGDLEVAETFLARYPESAAAPEVDFRRARIHLRAGRYRAAERIARRFGDRYPESPLRAEADWFVAFALFAEERYDEADAAARASLARSYPGPDGEKDRRPYEKNLIHLRAQVAHVKGRLDEAIDLYRRVADVSVDAREALRLLTEKTLSVPAVTRVAPGAAAKIEVTSRNLDRATLELYPVDILVYFALEKDVSRVAGLNLTGLPATITRAAEIGQGGSRRETTASVALGVLPEPGVSLVIARSGELERRGILLVSDLDATIRRYPEGVRVVVTEHGSGEPVPGAYVKIAAGGRIVGEGRTDPRGFFEVREKLSGGLSAVARKGARAALATD